MTDPLQPPAPEAGTRDPKTLPPAARRALEEARLRREASLSETRPAEVHGRDGPEPTRFGDWEKNGIVSDF